MFAGAILILASLSQTCSAMPIAHKRLMSLNKGKPASVSRVMSGVADLLQKRVNKVQRGTDAIEVFNEALESTISDIQKQVQEPISASHTKTQEEIEKRVGEVSTANTALNDQKKIADNADTEWMNCVEREKGLAKDIEDATAALTQATNHRVTTCQIEEDNKMFSYQMAAVNFVCDISEYPEHNCDVQWQEFLTTFESEFETFEDDTDIAVEGHQRRASDCTTAQGEETEKDKQRTKTIGEYEKQHELCVGLDQDRQQAMCDTESRYNDKCRLVEDYETLMTEIDTEGGNDYSKIDRIAEWKMTSLTICLFRKIMETSEVNSGHVENCESDESAMDTQHLNLERQQETITDLTSGDNYGCAETSIKFQGETWDFPDSAPEPPAPEAAYVRSSYVPELPFSFCASDIVPGPGK